MENNEKEHRILCEFHIRYNILLKERTQTINNKIKLHILGVLMNRLGNWLIHHPTHYILRHSRDKPFHAIGFTGTHN